MKQLLARFWQVVRREIKLIAKDIDLITILLFSPMFYVLFYGTVYLHKNETNVPIVVVDQSHTALSRTLIRNLETHQKLRVVATINHLEEARRFINAYQAQGALFIPADFSKRVKQGRSAVLQLYVNASRFLPANDINKAVQEVVGTLGDGVQLRRLQASGLNEGQARKQIIPIGLDNRNTFSFSQSYGDFLIPGLLALILQQTLIFGLAMSVARESEFNTFGELLQLSNHNLWILTGGKSFFYLILYLTYALLFISSSTFLYKIPFRGDLRVFMVLTFVFLLAVIYLSLFLGTFFKRKIVALLFLVFTSYPLFLLSGFSWPLLAMPQYMRLLAQFFPITPYLKALPRVTAMGADFQHIWPELLHLLILALLGMLLTHWQMKRFLKISISSSLNPLISGFTKSE